MGDEKSYQEKLAEFGGTDAGAKVSSDEEAEAANETVQYEYVGDRFAELENEQESDEEDGLDEDEEPRS